MTRAGQGLSATLSKGCVSRETLCAWDTSSCEPCAAQSRLRPSLPGRTLPARSPAGQGTARAVQAHVL